MYKHYFTIGFRHLMRRKAFTFLNISGLAMAMAVSLLILLMIADQLSTDQFNSKKDQILRVNTLLEESWKPNASSPVPLANLLRTEFPEVEATTHLIKGVGGDLINAAGRKSTEVRGFFADPHLLRIFDFKLLAGSLNECLEGPRKVVITREVALKLFGTENPVGRSVALDNRNLAIIKFDLGTSGGEQVEDWGSYVVSGVIDTRDQPSHLVFDVLVSESTIPELSGKGLYNSLAENWLDHSQSYTYVALREGSSKEEFTVKLGAVSQERFKDLSIRKRLIIQSLDDIRMGSFTGNPPSLLLPIQAYYFLAILAGLILLSACFNYTNLTIARALTRAREIGIRKVNGAIGRNISGQFMVESVLVSLFALVLAVGIVFLIRPAMLNMWIMRHLHFDLTGEWQVIYWFLGFALFSGLLAGIYPAWILSKFSPIKALRNGENDNNRSRLGARKVLNVFQFAFSLLFIVSALLISKQFRHFAEFDHGMQVDQVINLPLQGNDFNLVKEQFSSVAGVAQISGCQTLLATPESGGAAIQLTNSKEAISSEFMAVDQDFAQLLSLNLVAGEDLSGNENQILINEFGAKQLGFEDPSTALGETILSSATESSLRIVGVVKDFAFQTPVLGEGDRSLILHNHLAPIRYAMVKIDGGQPEQVLERMHNAWEAMDPKHPFQYEWYNETLVSSNQWMGDLATIISTIALLAIIISCLGLLGMATYTTERRVKEVSIRKILGANISSLGLLLGRSFLIILLISVIAGVPLSYFVNTLWLDNLPNRVDLDFLLFFKGVSIMLGLGLMAIASQVVKITHTDPVHTLRNE